MLNEEKSCLIKNWLRANFSSNIFRLIQHNFLVGPAYSLFHLTFHFYAVISNVRTLNFEWFNKTKTLCNIKNHAHQIKMTLNSSEADSDHLSKLQEQNGKNTKMQQKKLKIAEKEKTSITKKVYKRNRKKERLKKLRKMGTTKKTRTITKWLTSCPSPYFFL